MIRLNDDQKAILIHLEMRAVAYRGLVDPRQLKWPGALEAAESLAEAGLIYFGPLPDEADVVRITRCTHFVVFTYDAFAWVHQARQEQAIHSMEAVVWDAAGQPHDGIGGGLVVRREIIEDPLLEIRAAVADTLRTFDVRNDSRGNYIDHKEFTDVVIDRLPDFFRQALTGATGTPAIDGSTKGAAHDSEVSAETPAANAETAGSTPAASTRTRCLVVLRDALEPFSANREDQMAAIEAMLAFLSTCAAALSGNSVSMPEALIDEAAGEMAEVLQNTFGVEVFR